MRIGYMNWAQEKFYVTQIEKYWKGNEYAYRIYELGTRKILCHTDRKISKKVTDIKSTDWTQSPVD